MRILFFLLLPILTFAECKPGEDTKSFNICIYKGKEFVTMITREELQLDFKGETSLDINVHLENKATIDAIVRAKMGTGKK